MRVSIHTLGCKVNQSESASIEGVLRNNNYEIVKHADNPDVCIVNTCTVTAKSDQQSRQLIRKAIKSGAKVIATGCYAQLRPDELSEIKGLSFVVGNSDKENIVSCIQSLADEAKYGHASSGCKVSVSPPTAPMKPQPYYSSRSRAFLKIQDGCNFSCTYCSVPLARGVSRSLHPDSVVSSAAKIVADGYGEIVLSGIHIGTYGSDLTPKKSLIDIVRRIADKFPQVRIRLSSIEPQEFNNDFLDLIKHEAVCPHLHIPLQSGSARILKEMNRGYTPEFYKQLINSVITSCPDVSIGTDIIVGFPGESDNDFIDTVNLVNNLPLTYFHVFPYSMRPNTKASLFSDQISGKVKKERVRTLIEIGKIKKKNYMAKYLGKTLYVIVEQKSASNRFYYAISDNYLRILVESSTMISGKKIKVKVTSLTEDGIIAEPLK